MDFSAGSHTFSAAQEFTKGSSFGENQSFGAGVGHNFFKDDMAFLAGTDFGAQPEHLVKAFSNWCAELG